MAEYTPGYLVVHHPFLSISSFPYAFLFALWTRNNNSLNSSSVNTRIFAVPFAGRTFQSLQDFTHWVSFNKFAFKSEYLVWNWKIPVKGMSNKIELQWHVCVTMFWLKLSRAFVPFVRVKSRNSLSPITVAKVCQTFKFQTQLKQMVATVY